MEKPKHLQISSMKEFDLHDHFSAVESINSCFNDMMNIHKDGQEKKKGSPVATINTNHTNHNHCHCHSQIDTSPVKNVVPIKKEVIIDPMKFTEVNDLLPPLEEHPFPKPFFGKPLPSLLETNPVPLREPRKIFKPTKKTAKKKKSKGGRKRQGPKKLLPLVKTKRKGKRKKRRRGGDSTGDQKDCCVKDCVNEVTNRLRFSLRCLREEDFKKTHLEKGYDKVCHYHYFSDLYKFKKAKKLGKIKV